MDVYSPETKDQILKAFEVLVSNILELTTHLPGQKTKEQICEKLGYPMDKCKFQMFTDLSGDIERDFIFDQLITEGLAEEVFVSTDEYAFDGRMLRQTYGDQTELKIGNKSIITSLKSIAVIIDDYKFIMMPNYYEENSSEFKGRYWICAHYKDIENIVDIKNNLINKYSLFKNRLIEVRQTFEIINDDSIFGLDDIVVPENIRQLSFEIVELIKSYDVIRTNGIHIHKGILIKGIPGTGKSTTCNAIIKEALKNGATCIKIYNVNTGARTISISECFEIAQKFGPAIVILEDADVIKRDSGSHNRVTNDLLKSLEDSGKYPNVICLCTTNDENEIDQAIRPGRIDRIINFSFPTINEIRKLFEIHVKKYDLTLKSDLYDAIEQDLIVIDNITGAAINNICLELKRYCIINNVVNINDYSIYKKIKSDMVFSKSINTAII